MATPSFFASAASIIRESRTKFRLSGMDELKRLLAEGVVSTSDFLRMTAELRSSRPSSSTPNTSPEISSDAPEDSEDDTTVAESPAIADQEMVESEDGSAAAPSPQESTSAIDTSLLDAKVIAFVKIFKAAPAAVGRGGMQHQPLQPQRACTRASCARRRRQALACTIRARCEREPRAVSPLQQRQQQREPQERPSWRAPLGAEATQRTLRPGSNPGQGVEGGRGLERVLSHEK